MWYVLVRDTARQYLVRDTISSTAVFAAASCLTKLRIEMRNRLPSLIFSRQISFSFARLITNFYGHLQDMIVSNGSFGKNS